MPVNASPQPLVTISIVSHRQWALIEPLIDQLEQWCAGVVAKVILTVNAPENLRLNPSRRIPVERIENAQPKGFGANHNAAFARCETPWFLILNPDIRLQGDVISALLQSARPRTGLLTPRILEPGSAEPEPYRELLTPLELVRRRLSGHRPPDRPAWVAGMFMLLRREAFAQVGGFDERYFMYCEDFDLCARLRLGGWALEAEPSISVFHLAQRASQAELRPLLWHLASFTKVWTSRAFWRYRQLLKHEASTVP